jgi:hypothetical protein
MPQRRYAARLRGRRPRREGEIGSRLRCGHEPEPRPCGQAGGRNSWLTSFDQPSDARSGEPDQKDQASTRASDGRSNRLLSLGIGFRVPMRPGRCRSRQHGQKGKCAHSRGLSTAPRSWATINAGTSPVQSRQRCSTARGRPRYPLGTRLTFSRCHLHRFGATGASSGSGREHARERCDARRNVCDGHHR